MSEPVEISINGASHRILCGFCKAPIAFRGEPDIEGEVGCSACDNWATVQEAADIAVEHFEIKHGERFIDSRIESLSRGNKALKLTKKTSENKVHRFVVDL